jgi:predicted nucleic-acid-binding protein
MKKSKARLSDTNTILRYLLKDEEDLYGKAAVVFEDVRAGRERAIILESVLVECVYILTKFYKVPRSEAADILVRFLGYKGIMNNDVRELTESLAMFANSTMDIVDCLLFVKSRNYALSLFTFDKKLAAKGKQPAK